MSFNFNYIMIVMYRTSPLSVCRMKLKMLLVKQFSHQIRQHEKAPEFQKISLECCIYDIRMLQVTVWNVMCIGVICVCTEGIRIVYCIGINLCL